MDESLKAVTPGLGRRLACMLYESLLVLAVLFLAGFLVVGLVPADAGPWVRAMSQLYYLLVAGLYFVWFWRHGGQTLAMKTWRIRLRTRDGGRPTLAQCWRRYILALAGLAALGAGFLWALWDRDGQFLHDRLVGTRLVRTDLG